MARLALLALLAILDKSFLDVFVDSTRAQTAGGLGALLYDAQHAGFRYLACFAAALLLFASVRSEHVLASRVASFRRTPLRFRWLWVHAALVAILAIPSFRLYRYTSSDLELAAIAAAWITLALGAAVAALLFLAPWSLWRSLAHAVGRAWLYAAFTALVATSLMQCAQNFWTLTSAITFELVERVLEPLMPSLAADPARLILRSDHFAIRIADPCSGLEGMGLILAFCAAWLWYFRREYRFPQALGIIPMGLLAIFILNVLRIAAFMWIGDSGHPDIAVLGFHSQAGWIAFNAVACALVFFSRRSGALYRAASPMLVVPVGEATASSVPALSRNPTAAYLMPLLASIAAGLVSHAMSGRFEFLYVLRPMAALAMLLVYRSYYRDIPWTLTGRSLIVGLMTFIVWIAAVGLSTSRTPMPTDLAALSAPTRVLWILGRAISAVFILPFVEELAYRGYLMRRLSDANFEAVQYPRVRWPAIAVSSIVFGLSHGTWWIPGTLSGLAFGLLARRGGLTEAIAAHAVCNALLAIAVLSGGQWQLW